MLYTKFFHVRVARGMDPIGMRTRETGANSPLSHILARDGCRIIDRGICHLGWLAPANLPWGAAVVLERTRRTFFPSREFSYRIPSLPIPIAPGPQETTCIDSGCVHR